MDADDMLTPLKTRLKQENIAFTNVGTLSVPYIKIQVSDGSEISLLSFDTVSLFRDADESDKRYVLRRMDAGEDSDHFYSDMIHDEKQARCLYDLVRSGVLA